MRRDLRNGKVEFSFDHIVQSGLQSGFKCSALNSCMAEHDTVGTETACVLF